LSTQLLSRVSRREYRYYTPPQESGQDFAPSRVENVIMRVDFIDKSPEIRGNAFARKMECGDNYEGRI
jgi:hypothetical protein